MNYLDPHHIGFLASVLLHPDSSRILLDNPAATTTTATTSTTTSTTNVLIIGLAGGAFPMAVRKYMPSSICLVCDIDANSQIIYAK